MGCRIGPQGPGVYSGSGISLHLLGDGGTDFIVSQYHGCLDMRMWYKLNVSNSTTRRWQHLVGLNLPRGQFALDHAQIALTNLAVGLHQITTVPLHDEQDIVTLRVPIVAQSGSGRVIWSLSATRERWVIGLRHPAPPLI